MSAQSEEQSLTKIRRHDRAVTDDAWIVDLLQRAAMGTLATVDDEQPFLNTNLFVYDPSVHCIYLHTARSGRTRDNVDASAKVCFSVSTMGRLLPAEIALKFSVEYASVVVFGRAEFVEDEAAATAALQLLLDKYFPHLQAGTHYRPIVPAEIALTTVYRIVIEQWSGKQKQVAANFPGAFHYGDPAIYGDLLADWPPHGNDTSESGS